MTIEPAIDLRRAIDPQIASLRRLDALMRGDILETRAQRLVRLVEALRAAAAIAACASLRAIGGGACGGAWPGAGEPCQSLASSARDLCGGRRCDGRERCGE